MRCLSNFKHKFIEYKFYNFILLSSIERDAKVNGLDSSLKELQENIKT